MSEDIGQVCRKFNIRVVGLSAQCWPRWRIYYLLVSNPMWHIVSPVAAVRSTSERPNGDWRQDWSNTGMSMWGRWWRSRCSRACVGEPPPDPLDHDRGQELLVKEALHIHGGLEVPGCWTTVMRRQGEQSSLTFDLQWHVGCLLPTWVRKVTCQHFDWMLQSSSGWKWKKYSQTLLFIAMHYWGSSLSVDITPIPSYTSDLQSCSSRWLNIDIMTITVIVVPQASGVQGPPSAVLSIHEGKDKGNM